MNPDNRTVAETQLRMLLDAANVHVASLTAILETANTRSQYIMLSSAVMEAQATVVSLKILLGD